MNDDFEFVRPAHTQYEDWLGTVSIDNAGATNLQSELGIRGDAGFLIGFSAGRSEGQAHFTPYLSRELSVDAIIAASDENGRVIDVYRVAVPYEHFRGRTSSATLWHLFEPSFKRFEITATRCWYREREPRRMRIVGDIDWKDVVAEEDSADGP